MKVVTQTETHELTIQTHHVLEEVDKANFQVFGYLDHETGQLKKRHIALGGYGLYLLCAYNDDYMDGDYTHLLAQCNFDAWDSATRVIRKYRLRAKHIKLMRFERFDADEQTNVYEYTAVYDRKTKRFKEYIDPDYHFSNLMYYTDKDVLGITSAVLSE